jgi:hypothetical protein
MNAFRLTHLAAALALTACESNTESAALGADADVAAAADTASSDAATPDDDAQANDTTATDAATDGDAASPDAAPDTSDSVGPMDTSEDISNCEYLENPIYLICGPNSRPNQFLQWDAIGDPTCPPYYTDGLARHDTVASLASAAGCEAGCVFRAAQAVDFIRCDGAGRSGYETFVSDAPGCEDTTIYRTADGAFTDLCLWPTYLCYCGEL